MKRPDPHRGTNYLEPGWYRHFKGDLYFVLTTGLHTETKQPLVTYLDKENKTWCRPLDMFTGTVPRVVDGDGSTIPRFEKVNTSGDEPLVLPLMDLSSAKSLVVRTALLHSFNNNTRWEFKLCRDLIPWKLMYMDPLQRFNVTLCNNTSGVNNVHSYHKIPYTLVYEAYHPRKSRKVDLWASFSNRIERP